MSDYENTRAYITSRLEELGSLDKLAEEMPGSRRGNGWDSSKLDEAVFRVLPQPLEKLARKAIRPRVFRMIADWFRPAYATSRVAGPPTVIYFPLWYLTGYHECFYLRKGNYKIRVDKDVVAVEVDGETRDLMIEEEESKIVPEAFRRRLIDVAGFRFVPEPIAMRNSKSSVIYYLYFASQNKTRAKIVSDIFKKYANRMA